ncbi:MAG: DegV family protein [Coriobacteriia bacterium]
MSDSTCDLPEDLLLRCGVATVPVVVDIDGREFHEGVDITTPEFYERMARSESLPRTSQPSPAVFAERFDELAPKGEIICLTVSSKLSGTHQSACLAAELSDAEVTVFDTLTASVAHGLQVLRACELAKAGSSAAEALASLVEYRGSMTTLVLLDTLENIVKGGRLSRLQWNLSKLLDIRVLLRDADGEIAVLAKVRGKHRLVDRAINTIGELRSDLSDRYVGISHFRNPEVVEVLKRVLTERFHPRGFVISDMGPALATYAGEGGVIVAF